MQVKTFRSRETLLFIFLFIFVLAGFPIGSKAQERTDTTKKRPAILKQKVSTKTMEVKVEKEEKEEKEEKKKKTVCDTNPLAGCDPCAVKIPPRDLCAVKKLSLAQPYGYMQLDYANYRWDKTRMGSGAELRRGRLGLKGSPYPYWNYNILFDMTKNRFQTIYFYLQYTGYDWFDITIGQSKEPFSIEWLTTILYVTFMERSLPVQAFIPPFPINIKATSYGIFSSYFPHDSYTWGISLFGKRVGDSPPNELTQGYGVSGRWTFAHYPCEDELFEIGVNGMFRKPDTDRVFVFNSLPESGVTNVTLVNTGNILRSSQFWQYGLEATTVLGPFSLQGEVMANTVRRINNLPVRRINNLQNLSFNGWYLFGSWFITGEHRTFDPKDAVFTSIAPLRCWGAIELAARISALNLNSHDIRGGYEKDFTFGTNWWVNPHVRFAFNYIKVHASRQGLINNDNIFTVRAQIDAG